MTQAETTSNGIETLSDRELLERIWAKLEILSLQVEDETSQSRQRDLHHDSSLHEIRQFIDQHRPLLERFTDPGSAVRAFLPGGRKVKGNGNG